VELRGSNCPDDDSASTNLARVLASDNYGDTLNVLSEKLIQRGRRNFMNILLNAHENKEPFIIPPLVGNCNSEIEFQEFGNTNVGVARFPMDAEIKLFDGQHRAAGIAEFCRTVGEPIHVPLMLTHKFH
jgi:DGQHR domain-containing protein